MPPTDPVMIAARNERRRVKAIERRQRQQDNPTAAPASQPQPQINVIAFPTADPIPPPNTCPNLQNDPATPSTPPSQRRLFSDHTPATPATRERHRIRPRISTHATPTTSPVVTRAITVITQRQAQPPLGNNPDLQQDLFEDYAPPASPTAERPPSQLHFGTAPAPPPTPTPPALFTPASTNRPPARRIGGSRHPDARPLPQGDLRQDVRAPAPIPAEQNEDGHPLPRRHPSRSGLRWCSKNKHYKPLRKFGSRLVNRQNVPYLTCSDCRSRPRNLQQQAAHAEGLNQEVDEQMQVPEPVPQPQNAGPEVVNVGDVLLDSALSQEDKQLLYSWRDAMMSEQQEYCSSCREEWFDLKVNGDGICGRCQKSAKFTAANNMDPGEGPNLPELSQMEEILISPVHAMMQLWNVRGGQTKYTGHTCNFMRDTEAFHHRVPLLPNEVDILIVRRRDYLTQHHPTFQSRRVRVDQAYIDQLPVDGLVHDRVRSVQVEERENVAQEEGPPEEESQSSAEPVDGSHPVFTRGFVPNLQENHTEFDLLRAAAQSANGQVIISLPQIGATPMNEHMGQQIAVDAFPTLFPSGKADINATRAQSVDMKDWAEHLMKLKGGRFAKHPRFRYWVLNTIMRHSAKKKSRWYVNSHPGDRITVEDLRVMVDEGNINELAQRVSRAVADIPGTRPFWQTAQRNLTAQIRSDDCGSPSVFFTASSADIQWPDMHQHMPGYDINAPEDATSYRRRMENLNDNPALAAYYFQMRWEKFFTMVLCKKFTITDYWWRYEWQHRGSSHIHGFLWIGDAPNVDNLNMENPTDATEFIRYWDQHISTMNPSQSEPPAEIHPSARLFNSLEDTKQELAQMLNRLQRHTRCTPGYCERRNKTTGDTICRFGFPFDTRDTSTFIRPNGQNYPEFHTRRNDTILNPHNITFLLGWRANIDFRPVINREAVIAYVAKYASKGEAKSHSYQDLLLKSISHLSDTDPVQVAYQKMLSSFVGERDISGQEVAHILLGCQLVRSSRLYRNLPVLQEESAEVDFSTAELARKALLNNYLQRDIREDQMRDVTLLEFAKYYDKKKTVTTPDGIRIQYRRRGARSAKPYIVRVWPRHTSNPEDVEGFENHCYAKMILHHAFSDHVSYCENQTWRETLKGGCETWKQAYEELCVGQGHIHPQDGLPLRSEVQDDGEVSENESVPGDEPEIYQPQWMNEAGRRPNEPLVVEANNLGNRLVDNYPWVDNSPGSRTCNEARNWLSDQVKSSPNDDAQDLPDNIDWRTLKGSQRDVFLQVMAYCQHLISAPDVQPPPLRINVDGTAGTGKSWVIWSITQALRELVGNNGTDPVCRLAPTGIAAYGIRGWTINFGVSIPAKERGGFKSLSAAGLTRAQSRWKEFKILIIDEKSMVGRTQFGRLDRRLRQILANPQEFFGGMSVILFGDFAQLPPVGDSALYSTTVSPAHGGLPNEGACAYQAFNKSITLSTVHRQAGSDPEQVKFREALMNLRTYQINQQDFELLSTRFWPNLDLAERQLFESALHLLPTKELVAQYNQKFLAGCGNPVLKCKAKHSSAEAAKASDEDAEGLTTEVLLCEGATVMITRNLWTSKGLVNGARGTVKKIWFSAGSNPKKDLPAVVFLDIPGYTGPDNPGFGVEGIDPRWVPVAPVTSRWENRSEQQLSRTQFPLVPAWAITVHKSQGLTLNHVVVELGPSDFSLGLSFVALSRVKTLKGLAIRSAFGISRLQRPNETPTMRMLDADNTRRRIMHDQFDVETYGMDLSYWLEAFSDVDMQQ